MSFERWGGKRFGGDVRTVASDVAEGGVGWLWNVWTAPGECNGGVAADQTQALEAAMHALDVDQGAPPRGFADKSVIVPGTRAERSE